MPYRILDTVATADIAFEAWDVEIEKLFCNSADALMSVMVNDIETISERHHLPLEKENKFLDMLLFQVLEELVFLKDSKQMFYRIKEVKISESENTIHFCGTLYGEKIDSAKHMMLVDVKAVTLHDFYVKKDGPLWKTQITLDI